LRLLHDFKLGEKNLVVKVDAKTRKDLLKYITRKKRTAKNLPIDDDEIEKEVAEIEDRDGGIAALRQEVDDDMKDEDARIIGAIKSLAKENIEILSSSRSSKDEQLERDVKDALLSMAKQSGKIDPDVSPETYTYEYLTSDIVDCLSHFYTYTNNTRTYTHSHIHTHLPCTHLTRTEHP